jgi:hypothetical protein
MYISKPGDTAAAREASENIMNAAFQVVGTPYSDLGSSLVGFHRHCCLTRCPGGGFWERGGQNQLYSGLLCDLTKGYSGVLPLVTGYRTADPHTGRMYRVLNLLLEEKPTYLFINANPLGRQPGELAGLVAQAETRSLSLRIPAQTAAQAPEPAPVV